MSQLTILLWFDDYCGGAEKHTIQLAEALIARGHQLRLLVNSLQESSLRSFIDKCGATKLQSTVHTAEFSNQMSRSRAAELLHHFQSDVWVVPKGGYGSGSLTFEMESKRRESPLVVIEHQTPPVLAAESRPYLKRWGFWQVMFRYQQWKRSVGPTKIITVSETAAKRFQNEFWYPSKKTVGIPNGVNVKQFKPVSAQERLTLRKNLGLLSNIKVCGMVCRLSDAKGIDIAIEAIGSCLQNKNDQMIVFGDGPLGPALKQLTSDLRVDRQVTWAGQTESPWEIYPAFDFFLLPSRQEGLPLALLESMACGAIPVATPVGGVPDVILDGANGLIAKSCSVPDFSDAWRRAMTLSPLQREQMSSAARLQVESNFSLERQMEKICITIESQIRAQS